MPHVAPCRTLCTACLAPLCAADFDEALAAAQGATAGPVFVFCTGEVKEETGVSWCPDCVAVESAVHSGVAAVAKAAGGGTLLVCLVNREEYRGNPEYPYRKTLGLPEGIPALLKWGRSKAVARLDGAALTVDNIVATLGDE